MGKKKRKAGENNENEGPNEPPQKSYQIQPLSGPLPLRDLDVIFGYAKPRPIPKIDSSDPQAGKAWRLSLSEKEILDILNRAEVESIKLMPLGSNYTFLSALRDPETKKEYAAVYKPVRGEAPLWDFPNGTLYKREQAAYLVTRALGWNFIPPTVVREGPHGVGTMQLFVDMDESLHLYQFREQHLHELQRVAVFDLITNNADRKAGHCLLGLDGYLWGIDHGLCFNTVPKLRTIIWEFGGNPIPENIINDMMELYTNYERQCNLRAQLEELLERREVDVFFKRLENLLEEPVFPSISSRRQVPWGFF